MLASACFSKPRFDAPHDGPPIGPCAWQSITGLLAYLPFDDGSGTDASDLSPNGNVGDLSGASWTTGRISNAVSFSGDHFVSLRSPAILDNIGALTVCAWIFLDESPMFAATIADKSSDGFVGGWNFYVQAAMVNRVGFLSNAGTSIYGSNSVALQAWTHVCASWDGTTDPNAILLYRNGNLEPKGDDGIDTNPSDPSDAAEDLVLGRATNANNYNLVGKLDEFFLFDRVLSPTEIASLHSCAD